MSDGSDFSTVSKNTAYWYFILGVISAFCFRAVTVLQKLQPDWVRIVWYIAVVGYVFFFYFRYAISKKRRAAIAKYRLMEKLDSDEPLSPDERSALRYVLASLMKSWEMYNYYAVFVLSILAIIADLAVNW